MNDPYKVLGVQRNASEEEIKNAYRNLARSINEMDGERAAAKMQELNEAYDRIIEEKRSQGSGSRTESYSYGNTSGGGSNYYRTSGNYTDIRSLLNSNRLSEAEQLLDGIPNSSRDAEWYYLKGLLLQKKGWLEDSYSHFSTACRMDPNNTEYRNALDNISGYNRNGYGGYRTGPAYNQNRGCSGCDVCTGLMCADCCCECMGGDLIRCC